MTDINDVVIICAECSKKSVIDSELIDDIERPVCTSCREELNPFLMFQTIRTKLLIQIMTGELDPYELIKAELKNRRYVRMKSGRWVQQ